MFKILPVLLLCSRLLEAAMYSPGGMKYPGPSNARQGRNDPAVPCTRKDGQVGECVPYYLCNENINSPSNYHGSIDVIVQGDQCTSSIDTCCLRSERRPPNQPVKPVQPTARTGCGWANPDGVSFININGNNGETKFGEFPWMVAILNRDQDNKNQSGDQQPHAFIGGGSLIHPSVVLTAAHVVKDAKSLVIRAGDWDTQTDKEIYPYQERNVESVRIHEDFVAGNLFYDIAVVFLAEPVQLTPNVGVVCLPTAGIHQEEGNRCIATGWGKDKFGKEGRYAVILKKVDLPVVKHDKCELALRKTRLGELFLLHSSFMCAGGEPDKDSCTGDGGSPLSCPIEYSKDRYVQGGIVSWGIGCGGGGIPGVFVDVSGLRNWIDDKVAGKGYDTRVYTY
ncbi:phenoloxidase-activating factor 2-like [Helicoverpa zea]|uniref:phenoloxidase-activating factor 2-like n=1 Tax=Helicoverpa zea TaxID=7113 RepID=UPI001F5907C6|nr:phenoloxidase-activating factor 2-like [Helicoverpa zea]